MDDDSEQRKQGLIMVANDTNKGGWWRVTIVYGGRRQWRWPGVVADGGGGWRQKTIDKINGERKNW